VEDFGNQYEIMKNSGLIKWLLISILVVAGVWDGWRELKAQGADLLPIRYVRIEGVFQYITKDEIKQALQAHVMTGFLNADMHLIRQALLSLPWIAQVKVKRVWPDAIEIKVYEQYPVARWNNIGLLNEQGDLFMPNNLAKFNKLPLLYGPLGQENKLMTVMKQLQAELANQSLGLAEFYVNERRAWTLVLTNELILKLGRKEPLQAFQRFLSTVPILGKDRMTAMAIVDLRYSNGFAVTQKPGIVPIDWKNNNPQPESTQ
jgi:cell division protein FtsQ